LEKEKLLQIILVGQPELYERLQLSELRQLRQRIAIYFHIKPLEKNDIRGYIYHRLTKVMRYPDAINNVIFTEKALDMIFKYTQGSPRSINILCDRALLAGFVSDTNAIDEHIIENCAREIMYCEHYI
jgi:general secretion pathway protein A